MTRTRNGKPLCAHLNTKGKPCGHYAKTKGKCYLHSQIKSTELDRAEAMKRDATLLAEGKGSVIADREEVRQFLTDVMRGEIKATLLSPLGTITEADPPIKERRECAALLARLEGWLGNDQKDEGPKVITGVMRPVRKE